MCRLLRLLGKVYGVPHPILASNSAFRRQIHRALCGRVPTLDHALSAAQKWEEVKRTTATIAKSFSRRNASTLKRAEEQPHKKRSIIQQCLHLDPTLKLELTP